MSLMSEDADPSGSHVAARAAANQGTGSLPNRVTFNRLELHRILNLYGRFGSKRFSRPFQQSA